MINALTIIVFILGFVLILKGGDFLVEASVAFANKAKIPPMVVGATVVAIATTFPETTVSLVSSFSGISEVGINTAVGSMVCNFTIVLGISFLLLPTAVNSKAIIVKCLYFCFTVLMLLIVGINGRVGITESVFLLLVLALFIVINCIEAKKYKTPTSLPPQNMPWLKIVVSFVCSAFAIGLGAMVLVNNVDAISEMLGIKGGFVSFIIIAVGTNLPELVTTITSVKLNSPEIGIGNIFGASIIDCTLLIACSVFASGSSFIVLSKTLLWLTVPTLFLITALIAMPIIKHNKTQRWQGVMLLSVYLIYAFLVLKFT